MKTPRTSNANLLPFVQPPAPSATNVAAWDRLKQWTPARIALGCVGGSMPVKEVLNFRLSHARARDAVHEELRCHELEDALKKLSLPALRLSSQVTNRFEYLQRPDRGRRLSPSSKETLLAESLRWLELDLVIILSDGLSATAAHTQSISVISELVPRLQGWNLGSVVIVPFARVALQDEIGQLLKARMALILIGERPGLGSPDSLGAYLVHTPQVGNTDAARNCFSNIRQEGLKPTEAAQQIAQLLIQARFAGYSGVQLKASDTPRLAPD